MVDTQNHDWRVRIGNWEPGHPATISLVRICVTVFISIVSSMVILGLVVPVMLLILFFVAAALLTVGGIVAIVLLGPVLLVLSPFILMSRWICHLWLKRTLRRQRPLRGNFYR